jgi:LEA14-like dessication related protein
MTAAKKGVVGNPLGWIPLISLLWINCAMVQQLVNIQRPSVEMGDIRFKGMNFDKVDLAVDLKVKNPNAVSFNLAAFDYDLQISGASFLKGNETKGQTVQAGGESRIEIPVTLVFRDLYKTYQTLKEKDSADYHIACGVSVNLPVLGATRIPVSKSGRMPLIKIPVVKVQSLKIKKMGFKGADLELALDVKNPNAFQFLINGMDYELAVNGSSWARGLVSDPVQMEKKGTSKIVFPLSLNFLQIGQSAVQALTGNQALNYQFKGHFGFESPVSSFEKIKLPVDLGGKISLTR